MDDLLEADADVAVAELSLVNADQLAVTAQGNGKVWKFRPNIKQRYRVLSLHGAVTLRLLLWQHWACKL